MKHTATAAIIRTNPVTYCAAIGIFAGNSGVTNNPAELMKYERHRHSEDACGNIRLICPAVYDRAVMEHTSYYQSQNKCIYLLYRHSMIQPEQHGLHEICRPERHDHLTGTQEYESEHDLLNKRGKNHRIDIPPRTHGLYGLNIQCILIRSGSCKRSDP